jgi:hypothetical protein
MYRPGGDDVVRDASAEGFDEETRTDGEDAGRPCSDSVGLDVFGMRDV